MKFIHGVLGMNDTLVEPGRAERRHRLDHIRRRFLTGNDFQQLHHFHGIEEVGHHDIPAQPPGHAFGDRTQRNARSVGGDHRTVAAPVLELREHVALGCEILDDSLADPVIVRDLRQIGEGTGLDQVDAVGIVDGRRSSVGNAAHRRVHGVAVQVKEQDPASRIRTLAGDSGSHGSGADHGHRVDRACHASLP